MKPPRGLTAAEAALWRQVTDTVAPLSKDPPPLGEVSSQSDDGGGKAGEALAKAPSATRFASGSPPPKGEDRRSAKPLSLTQGLDSTWERKLVRAAIAPDFTLDLHGCNLDQAHQRLDAGIMQAKAMGARLVLLITGKSRPAAAADRASSRGAIRAKVIDWLAAGPHASDIAAIRKAHRRHGGEGALYLVLKRRR